ELSPATFAQIGDLIPLRPGGNADVGGLTFDGVSAWYLTNGNGNHLVRLSDPPTAASWTNVDSGGGGGAINNTDLETYRGQIWGALQSGSLNRLLVGTLNLQTGAFQQMWDVAAVTGTPVVGLAVFTRGCIGIDRQPESRTSCSNGSAQFSVVA